MPALSMDRPVKAATPVPAARLVVPLRVLPPGLAPMASCTVPVKLVSVLPNGSRAETVALKLLPAVVLPGWVVKARWVVAAGLMLKPVEPAAVRLPELAVKV